MLALEDDPLEWAPTWTCLDYTNNLVSGFDLRRGRQTESDTTDVSTATVYLNDRDGLFDPGNVASPYYGTLDGAPVALQCWDPVEEEWVRQTRMWIDDIRYDFNPATRDGKSVLSNVQLECVDIFDHLASIQMVVGVFGVVPTPAGSEGTVWYDEEGVDERIEGILTEAGLADEWGIVFTGNVDVQGLGYDATDVLLTAIRDACDAEFPDLANCYSDKQGRFCFHGRRSRFEPDAVSATAGDAAWDFQRWAVGDGEAWVADHARAQIRTPLRWARSRSRIRNSAYATPRGVAEKAKAAQVVEDAVSIARYRRRPWRAEGLIVAAGTTTGFTALEETKALAEWQVATFANPITRLDQLTLKSVRPNHRAAAATWATLLRSDISDIVDVEHGYPGTAGVGLSEEFFIEGVEMQVRPANPDYDMVTTTLNTSPVSIYSDPGDLLD